MNKKKLICSFLVLSSYLLVTLLWSIFYIFMGEDVELNNSETYQSFIKFTMTYLAIITINMWLSKLKEVNVIITGIGLLIIPILIAGYVGSLSVDEKSLELINSRFLTLIIHSIVYIISVIKLTIKR